MQIRKAGAAWGAGKGKRPSWHLDCIEVHEVEAGHVWYFKCGDWLRSEGTGAVQKVLKVSVSGQDGVTPLPKACV